MLDGLLRRGYFPEELPPCFSTDTFANVVTTGVLPNGFSNGNKVSKILSHNLARAGTLRRELGIPNPILHYRLCECVANNWNAIDIHINASTLSHSIPVQGQSHERAFVTSTHMADLADICATYRANCRYILKTDISRFYHSIYTHSIPWALHTKPIAKAQRTNMRLLGNELDKLIRDAQDGQTIGVPIGPDTSLIIAEIIMASSDVRLTPPGSANFGLRYVDDYELCYKTASDAENGVAAVQETISEFELALNDKKTRIFDAPQALQPIWLHEVRHVNIRSTPRGQRSDIIWLLDTAFRFVRDYPDDSVLKYALVKLLNAQVDAANSSLLEDLVIQCAVAEPATLPEVLSLLLKLRQAGHLLNITRLEECLNTIIQRQGPLGHGSEVAWAVWGCLAFQVRLSQQACNAAVTVNDSIVSLLVLDAHQQRLTPSTLNLGNWVMKMTTQELYEEHWLLAYEANVQSWLPSIGAVDHVAADSCFNYLKQQGVKFYNPVIGPISPPRPRALPPAVNLSIP